VASSEEVKCSLRFVVFPGETDVIQDASVRERREQVSEEEAVLIQQLRRWRCAKLLNAWIILDSCCANV